MPRQLVRLKHDTDLVDGGFLPTGSVGIVRQTYPGGRLLDIQFLDFRGICMILRIELEPAI